MTKPWRPQSNVVPFKRLRGLDEFETPDFVGRMARAERRCSGFWRGTVVTVIVLGGVLGFML